jgi:hypothetical protein
MPAPTASNSGPVTRRQSKRNCNAVAEGAADPVEGPATKRVKTEATTQERLQLENGPGETNELQTIDAGNVDDSSNEDDANSSSGDSSSSSDEEPELLPARPANTGELLNEYLVSSMQAIARTTDQFTQQFVNEATARFGWMQAGDVVDWPPGGAPDILPEWEKNYAIDAGISSFRGFSTWKVKSSRDAQHAVRVIERCKQSKDRIADDEAFIKKWQRIWQKEVLAQHELMFSQILNPLQHHKRRLDTTGRALSTEITGYARRQTM